MVALLASLLALAVGLFGYLLGRRGVPPGTGPQVAAARKEAEAKADAERARIDDEAEAATSSLTTKTDQQLIDIIEGKAKP